MFNVYSIQISNLGKGVSIIEAVRISRPQCTIKNMLSHSSFFLQNVNAHNDMNTLCQILRELENYVLMPTKPYTPPPTNPIQTTSSRALSSATRTGRHDSGSDSGTGKNSYISKMKLKMLLRRWSYTMSSFQGEGSKILWQQYISEALLSKSQACTTCVHMCPAEYTGVSVSVLVRLPRPPPLLRNSLSVQILSVQYGYQDPSGTDSETASISVLL